MKVNLYDVADDGTETLEAENIDLRDCYPGEANDEDYWLARECLVRCGYHWTGGGAAPIRVIRLTYPNDGVVGSTAALCRS